MPTFTSQTAVITGAGSGIGKAIALALAAKGATLCLVGRRLDTLEAVAEHAGTAGKRLLCYQADLTLDTDLLELVGRLRRDFEHIDMLIHSAGVISLGSIEAAPTEDFDRQYRVNLRAPYMLTQALLPMLKLRQGQIVFMNSSAALNGKVNAGQYAATKLALKALADSLREEVNTEGLRVLSVFLGRTATPMQAAVHKMEGRTYHPENLLQPEDVASVVINAVGLPRTAEVTEISVRPLKKPESDHEL